MTGNGRPRLVHVSTSDMTLSLLLGPQLRAFAAAGYDVIGVSAAGPYVARLEADGIRHVELRNATRAMDLRRDAAAHLEMYRLLRELRPTIVHTHNPKPGWYGRLAGRAARVPIVVNTVHGLYALPDDRFRKRAAVYTFERIASTCSQAELLQNPEDLPVMRRLGIPERKLVILGNGIDLARFRPDRLSAARRAELRAEMGAGPDDVVCGVVARLVYEKGCREVFAAAERLRATAPNVRVVVVGPSDPDKADAVPESEIAAARESGVTFLGMRADVDDLYGAMDIYALASYREGFPRSAMEAAASGLPIVTTDVRGCRQVVDDERTGLLVPRRDADALAKAIATIAGDAGRRAEMGKAAIAKARAEFDQQRVIDITLDVYERLLRGERNFHDLGTSMTSELP